MELNDCIAVGLGWALMQTGKVNVYLQEVFIPTKVHVRVVTIAYSKWILCEYMYGYF